MDYLFNYPALALPHVARYVSNNQLRLENIHIWHCHHFDWDVQAGNENTYNFGWETFFYFTQPVCPIKADII